MILAAASSDDADALAALHAQGFPHPWSAADLVATAASPGASTLVVRGAPGAAPLAGFVMFRTVLDEAEILTLVVAASERRGGIGAALVAAAVGAAAAAGAATLWLEVAADNVAAIALYRAAGFAMAGRRRDYYARDVGAVDALVLRRALNTGAV